MSEGGAQHWWIVARREFLERVRSKWFIAVTILGPIGMAALVVLPTWLAAKGAEDDVRLEIVDRSGKDSLTDGLIAALPIFHSNFQLEKVDPTTTEETLRRRIRDQEINGYLLVPEDVMAGGEVLYRGDNATNLGLQREVYEIVNYSVRTLRAHEAGLSPTQILALQSIVRVDFKHTTGEGEEISALASFFMGYAVMFVLYIAILLYGVNVMRSVVLEKTNRVVELIVSATKPHQLMLGKILGVGGVGLLQLSLWAVVALGLLNFQGELLALFGLEDSGFSVPPLLVGDVVLALVFFVLGYFFYSSLFAAVGAMVNSDQEAQQAQTPIVVLLVIPAVCVQVVANDPRGGIAELLTLIPFTSPVLMPMRYLLDGAGPVDVALSVGILLLFTAAAVHLAGRIYRVGILLYGKRPGLRELLRWIKYPQ